jgi:hypothetical protein
MVFAVDEDKLTFAKVDNVSAAGRLRAVFHTLAKASLTATYGR